jgi:MFS family permease
VHEIAAPAAPVSLRRVLRLALIGLGAAVVPLDTAVNIGFPDITHSFGLSLAMIQWVVVCYVLTYASLMLAFGRIGDILGHALVFRIGLGWSVAAFLLCALAPSYGWLLFFRFLQGIGAGLVISVAPALVTGQFPEARRSRAVALFTMMFAIGSALGPLVGGTLVARWGWPAVFWFRAPIALVALLFLEGLPPARRRRETLDVLGAALLASGLAALLLAINRLQHWSEGAGLPLLLAAVALLALVGFVRWEGRVEAPIVNLGVFKSGGFAFINLASVIVYLTGFSVLLLAPYYLVRFTTLSLPMAGAVLAASFAAMIAASPLAGLLVTRLPAERLAGIGAVASGIGLVLIGGWGRTPPGWPALLLPLLLNGLGTGLFQVSYMDAVMRTLPPEHRGVAGSVAILTRTIGVVGGATLLTLIFHAVEAAAVAGGQSPAAGFLAAYALTFRVAGLTSAAVGIASALAVRLKA